MSKVTALLLIESVLDSVSVIIERSKKLERPQDFHSHDGMVLFDSIVLRLQVIGEQVKKLKLLFPEILKENTEIEWKKIMGLRDHISHDYESLNDYIIFDICKNYIPALQKSLEQIIEKLSGK